MKKWKVIRIVCTIVLLAIVLYCIISAVSIINSNKIYPKEVLGAVIINNWFEELCIGLLMLFPIPVLFVISIILLIVSQIKIKKDMGE